MCAGRILCAGWAQVDLVFGRLGAVFLQVLFACLTLQPSVEDPLGGRWAQSDGCVAQLGQCRLRNFWASLPSPSDVPGFISWLQVLQVRIAWKIEAGCVRWHRRLSVAWAFWEK